MKRGTLTLEDLSNDAVPLKGISNNAAPFEDISKEELLLKAIQDGKLETVQSLIAQNANVNFADSDEGTTPLMKAIQRGDSAIENALINAGADVNAKDVYGLSVLHYAAMFVSDNTQTLLDNGADAKALTKRNQTPLMLVGQNSANPVYEIVKALIKHGTPLEATDISGTTALFYAIENVTAVEALLAHNANVNAVNNNGNTPLFFATSRGYAKTTEALLVHQANANVINTIGETPLIAAVQGAVKAAREAAKKAAASKDSIPSNKDDRSTIPTSDYTATVKYLLRHGADVLAKTTANKTVLELASDAKDSQMMYVLALEGSKGKNRYVETKTPVSAQARAALYPAREKHLKDNAAYYVAFGLLQHPNEAKKALANEMLNSFKTYKVNLADNLEDIKKQQTENEDYINLIQRVISFPVLHLKNRILSAPTSPQPGLISTLISYDEYEDKRAQETADFILKERYKIVRK